MNFFSAALRAADNRLVAHDSPVENARRNWSQPTRIGIVRREARVQRQARAGMRLALDSTLNRRGALLARRNPD